MHTRFSTDKQPISKTDYGKSDRQKVYSFTVGHYNRHLHTHQSLLLSEIAGLRIGKLEIISIAKGSLEPCWHETFQCYNSKTSRSCQAWLAVLYM